MVLLTVLLKLLEALLLLMLLERLSPGALPPAGIDCMNASTCGGNKPSPPPEPRAATARRAARGVARGAAGATEAAASEAALRGGRRPRVTIPMILWAEKARGQGSLRNQRDQRIMASAYTSQWLASKNKASVSLNN
jgi:hypothetical protein